MPWAAPCPTRNRCTRAPKGRAAKQLASRKDKPVSAQQHEAFWLERVIAELLFRGFQASKEGVRWCLPQNRSR
jgi:hypothetical protein